MIEYNITYSDGIFANSEEEAIKKFIKVLKQNPEYVKDFGTIEVQNDGR